MEEGSHFPLRTGLEVAGNLEHVRVMEVEVALCEPEWMALKGHMDSQRDVDASSVEDH